MLELKVFVTMSGYAVLTSKPRVHKQLRYIPGPPFPCLIKYTNGAHFSGSVLICLFTVLGTTPATLSLRGEHSTTELDL